MLCVLLLCGSKRMGEPDPPLPRLLLLPPQPPTPVKSGVDVMIMSAPRWGFKELTRFWPELWVKGYPLGLGGGGVDALDEEFTGEGSPWISVEAPVVAIIRGHNWAQSLFQLVINISSMNLFTNLRIMITIWSKPVFGTFLFWVYCSRRQSASVFRSKTQETILNIFLRKFSDHQVSNQTYKTHVLCQQVTQLISTQKFQCDNSKQLCFLFLNTQVEIL